MKKFKVLFILFASVLLSANVAFAAKQFTKLQVKQIQTIIHDYLVTNPKVLVEASQVLQQQEIEKARVQSQSAIEKYSYQIFNDKDKPIIGNPKGTVTIAEFFDYQCPFCKTMGPLVDNLIKANKNLKVIFYEWPIHGGPSLYGTQAALAAMNQNKYYELHTALTKKGYPLTNKDILNIAKKLGINVDKLKEEMKSKNIENQIKDNFTLARNIKIMGTPAFIIGNTKTHQYKYIDGQTDQETLQKAIDAVK